MTPDYQASIEFLERWRQGGPWVLTAITLDKTSIETRTFRGHEEAIAWLTKHGTSRNIYFSVNPTDKDVTKKPKRADVQSLDWLHVDVDPRAGEDINKERDRIVELLRSPPEGVPAPTVIVFSGGGFQGFWRLTEPKDIDGEEGKYEEAARFNQALELAFGADNCHNVDRIMRLPGTINRPDARKLRKGRVEELAKLIEWHDDRIFPLSDFTPAAPVQTTKKGFGATRMVKVSGNVKRVDDVNQLPDKVADLCKILIVQGHDPDNPDRFESRSHALFYVCCELVRGGVDDDTIFAIITDPDFRISESVLNKGSSVEGYAIRQIERARENAIDPNLRKLNEKFAVVTIGGKVRCIFEDHDEALDRYRIVRMSFEDFRNLHMNQKVQNGTDAQGNPRYVQLGKWWLEHEARRQYDRLTFAPGRETPGAYNMWRGFAVEPKPGDKHQSFLAHIRKNVCGGSEELLNYVIGWMACAVQRPNSPGHTAIVLRGDQGVGKGFVARHFGKIFGRHFLQVSTAEHLTGHFNEHLRDCVVLFADEAFYAGDTKHIGTLKTLVTESSIMVTPKGVDTEMASNCLHIMMASNHDWVVPAGFKERRFCVLDVGDGNIQDGNYFNAMAAELRDGGYENLLHMLMHHDLSGFDVRTIPHTKALQDQKVHSFLPEQEWWFNKLRDGKLLVESEGWIPDILVEAMTSDFVEYTRQFGLHTRKGSATKLGQFLRSACPGEDLKRYQGRSAIQVGDKLVQRPYFYRFPGLQELRDWWDKKFGGPYEWPVVEELDGPEENTEEIPF